MMERCYSKKDSKRNITYKNVTVCKEWHNFQIFAEWFENNYIEKYHLDKDLLSNNKKIYSPETCIFIPSKLNIFLSNKNKKNTTGFIGVHWHIKNKKYNANINMYNEKTKTVKRKFLGSFNTKEKTGEAYIQARKIESNKIKKWCKENTNLSNEIIEKIS